MLVNSSKMKHLINCVQVPLSFSKWKRIRLLQGRNSRLFCTMINSCFSHIENISVGNSLRPSNTPVKITHSRVLDTRCFKVWDEFCLFPLCRFCKLKNISFQSYPSKILTPKLISIVKCNKGSSKSFLGCGQICCVKMFTVKKFTLQQLPAQNINLRGWNEEEKIWKGCENKSFQDRKFWITDLMDNRSLCQTLHKHDILIEG